VLKHKLRWTTKIPITEWLCSSIFHSEP